MGMQTPLQTFCKGTFFSLYIQIFCHVCFMVILQLFAIQLIEQKDSIFLKKVVEKFGQLRQMLYFCTRKTAMVP